MFFMFSIDLSFRWRGSRVGGGEQKTPSLKFSNFQSSLDKIYIVIPFNKITFTFLARHCVHTTTQLVEEERSVASSIHSILDQVLKEIEDLRLTFQEFFFNVNRSCHKLAYVLAEQVTSTRRRCSL
jgi:hypothetical protein